MRGLFLLQFSLYIVRNMCVTFRLLFQEYLEKGRDVAVEEYSCANCKKVFPTEARLRSHECSQKIPCSWPQCQTVLASTQALKRHQHLHNETFKCQVCEKCYGSNSELSRHSLTHTGIKYLCEECGSSFTQVKNLQKHKKICHSDSEAMH